MSILPASGIGDESTGFYTTKIGQSLCFEDGDNAYLLRTPTSSGNRRTFTISFWIKIGNIDLTANIISVFQSASPNQQVVIRFYQNLLYLYDFGGAYLISTNRKFRDTTNWYHIVWAVDTTQSTSTDRIKLYVNGTQETDLNDTSYPSENHETLWNHTNKHLIGARTDNSTPTPIQRLDGYLAEFNLIDGTALTPSSFGETKNGVWIPKGITGLTYGTNGFRLTFGNSSDLGEDSAGSNDFSTGGSIASSNILSDSPTNNFCTMNPNFRAVTANTLSEGNLRVDTSTSGRSVNAGTFRMTTGKWYWEFRVDQSSGGMGVAKINGDGLGTGAYQSVTSTSTSTGSTDYYYGETNWVMYGNGIVHNATYVGGTGGGMGSPSYPQIWGVGIDMDASTPTITYYIDGSAVGSADLDADFDYVPIAGDGSGAVSRIIHINFGQNPTFNGTETAGTNSDGNGNGLFHDSVPSGYLALCSDNQPELTISPAQSSSAGDHFNTVIYTANNQTAQSITGVGFKPDWLWFKQRSRSDAHSWYDTTRGVGPILRLTSNTEYSNTTLVTSFDADGFSLGTDTNAWVNYQSDTMVAWLWKANGGTTSSNTEGSLTCTVQANTDAGFSIVTWTGDGNASVTLGHGLNAKPELIIYKGRENSFSWPTWFKTFGTTTGSFIDTNNAAGSFARVKSEPTATVIPNAELNYTNTNGEGSIAYVFHSVEGYSKIGSYTGNGSSDGVLVNLGFRPAWIIFKRVDTADNWAIYDVVRDTFNPLDSYLYADSQQAETTYSTAIVDFLSNGFKWRGAVNFGNNSSGTYIYMAFADQPFKFSNAR